MTALLARLTERERRLLLAGAVLLAALLLFQFGYLPLREFRANAARDRHNAEAVLAEVEARHARLLVLKAQAGKPPPATAALLRQAVASSAQARGIALSRLVPEADGGLSLVIERTTSEALFGWLSALEREAGVRVSKASIARDGAAPGLRAQIRFAGTGEV